MQLAYPFRLLASPALIHEAAAAMRNTAWVRTMVLWRLRLRHRQSLALLACKDIHMLQDVGLSPELLEAELSKPFWKG